MKMAPLALPLAVLFATGMAARAAAQRAWSGFVSYAPPFPVEPLPMEGAEPLTERVVLVVVDGLGLAPSRRLPFLNGLRARGADYAASVGLPSLSLPGRAALLSGARTDVHGQVTNHHPRPLAADHLFRVARRQGRTTALSAGTGGHALFAPHVSRPVVLAEDPETAPLDTYLASLRAQGAAARSLAEAGGALVVADLFVVDQAAHNWGTTSPEHASAIRAADEEIRRLAEVVDLSRATLVVTADHGHVPGGGHGGPEPPVLEVPLVLAGRGVKPGARGTARQMDVAPTLAALLGLPPPAASEGRPLFDALDASAERKAAVLRAVAAQRGHFAAIYRQGLGAHGPLPAPPAVPDVPSLAAHLDALDAAVEQGRAERMAREVAERAGAALALVVFPLALFGAVRARGLASASELRWAAAAGASAFALYHAALPAFGLSYTISAINKDADQAGFFGRDMALGLAAAVLAAAAGAWPARRSPFPGRWRGAWLAAGVLAALLLVKIALVYWRHGVFMCWHVPDQYWGFGFYLDALALMAAGLGASALLLVAAAVRVSPARAADDVRTAPDARRAL